MIVLVLTEGRRRKVGRRREGTRRDDDRFLWERRSNRALRRWARRTRRQPRWRVVASVDGRRPTGCGRGRTRVYNGGGRRWGWRGRGGACVDSGRGAALELEAAGVRG